MNAMDCEDAQLILDEWVRGAATEAESAPARAHAETCPGCTEFVDASRALSAGFKAWAEQESSLEASPRVGKALQAAFRQKSARRWNAPLVWGLGTAAAAALALLLVPAGHSVAPSPAQVAVAASTAEVSPTDPLFADPLGEDEAGEVVRVSLPASALHSMGLDLTEESPGEEVEADVTLDANGVARSFQVVE